MLGDQLCREVHRSDDGDLLTEYRANGDLKAVPSAWYAQTRTLRDEWGAFEACRANIDHLGLRQPEPLVSAEALSLRKR